MRDKWDSRRRDSTYGAQTIARAIADCTDTYTPPIEIEIDDTPDPETSSPPTVARVEVTDIWPTLANDALVGLMGDLVRALKPVTEADPVALLAHALCLWGNLVGRSPRTTVGADVHHLNENVLIVGNTSSGRKGLSASEIRAVLALVEPDWAATRQISGLSTGEGLINAVRDAREEQEPIKERGRIVGYQTVIVDAGVADKRLLCLESEFGKTLRISQRQGCTISATVRQAWDTGDLHVLTRQSPLRATGAHVSIVGHITPRELLDLVTTTDMASGFLNRFLLLVVRRSQYLPHGGALDPIVRDTLVQRFVTATEHARRINLVWRNDAADAYWVEMYPTLTRDRPGLVGDLSARAPAHVLRLSMLYALADGSAVIQREHVHAAVALWRYAEASTQRVFGRRVGHKLSDFLLAVLRAHAPAGLTRTQLNDALGRNRKAEDIHAALQLLLESGLVTRAHEAMTSGPGRPTTRWFAADFETK